MGNLLRSKTSSLLAKGIIVVTACYLATPIAQTPIPKGKSQIAKIQIKELEGALQLFSSDMGRYPTTAEGLDALVRNLGNSRSWMGPYLSNRQIPKDPWGRPYIYQCPGQHGAYDLLSYGSDGVEGGAEAGADVTSWEITARRSRSALGGLKAADGARRCPWHPGGSSGFSVVCEDSRRVGRPIRRAL